MVSGELIWGSLSRTLALPLPTEQSEQPLGCKIREEFNRHSDRHGLQQGQAHRWGPCSSDGRSSSAPLCWLLSAALPLGLTCGNIQTRWITFYHTDSNCSSRKFLRHPGNQMSLLSYASQSCDFLTQWNVKWQMPSLHQALWTASWTGALCTSGGRSSPRYTTVSPNVTYKKKKCNVAWEPAGYITGLQCYSLLIKNISSFLLPGSSHASENKYPYMQFVRHF